MSEWISVWDKLPTEADSDIDYRVWVYNPLREKAVRMSWDAVSKFVEPERITHWMPTGLKLPEPPK